MPAVHSHARLIGIAADDVTGATDSAVQFSRSGWISRLMLDTAHADQLEAGSAVAVSSDARPMEALLAQAATVEAVESLMKRGVDHLYLKIDSTMRGSVADQVKGALAAWRKYHPAGFAVVCPSYPAMGRTMENGTLWVHGLPLTDSPAGRDPVTPVTTNEMAELLPGTRIITLSDTSPVINAGLLKEAAAEGLVAVNAASDAELGVLADAIAAAGPMAVPAGSAGLAAAMSEAWLATPDDLEVQPPTQPAKRVVVVVSSVHDVAKAQTAHLRALLAPEDLLVLQPDADLFTASEDLDSWTSGQLTGTETLPQVVIILPPEGGPLLQLTGTAVARRVAAVVRRAMDHGNFDALVLVGGDGAHAVLDALGALALRITGAIQEGVPRGVIEGGSAAGKVVVTKAGGFGEASALLETVNELTKHIALPSEANS